MVAVKSLWVLLKSFSTNFSFKRDNGVRVPDHKPDKRIRYNRLRPQWHRPYYPSADPELGRAGPSSSSSLVNSSKSYQDYLNGNCGDEGGEPGGGTTGTTGGYHNSKEFDHFCDNSDSDYEDGDSDGEDFDDDFTTTDEDEDSDLDDDEDDGDEVLVCEVCERAFPTGKKLADHQEKKRHYGCPQCDSIFPSRKALDFHREEMDHVDFISDYGTDDAASFSSGSVRNGGNNSSSSSGVVSGGSSCCVSSSSTPTDENKCSIPGNTTNINTITPTGGVVGNTAGSQGRNYCSTRRPHNNNNYHCYSNQLHASWYEGDDEEEKGLLRTN